MFNFIFSSPDFNCVIVHFGPVRKMSLIAHEHAMPNNESILIHFCCEFINYH